MLDSGDSLIVLFEIHKMSTMSMPLKTIPDILAFRYFLKVSLVNVKLKWVKDLELDAVVVGENDVRAAWTLKDSIMDDPHNCVPIYYLSKQRRQLGLSHIKVSSFMRRYPSIFQEFPPHGNVKVPWFRLTSEATNLHHEELETLAATETSLVQRLSRLLMLTHNRTLPLQTIDQLKWDIGLSYDYPKTLIPRYPQVFKCIALPDDRVALQLCCWDDCLAVSELERHLCTTNHDPGDRCLEFPVKFTRGFGLKRKCMMWLHEWQKLPYTSPYTGPSGLDPRTDMSEKWIVGVFHEFLHLTMGKRTERKNLSNLREPLRLPQKFTKVFGRHPGIFYISRKGGTETVMLREAYQGSELIEAHPLLRIRWKFAELMRQGRLDKSRGLHKASVENRKAH